MSYVITAVYAVLLAWGTWVGVRQVWQSFAKPDSLLNPLIANPVARVMFAVHFGLCLLDFFVIGPWAIANKSAWWYWGMRIAMLLGSLPIASFLNRNSASFGGFIGRWVRIRNFFEYGMHILIAALPLDWFNLYLLHYWLVAYRLLDVGPRRFFRQRRTLNWIIIFSIYVGAFAAVWFGQVLFARVPGPEVPVHVPASWEIAVVVLLNLGVAIWTWLTAAKYVRSLKPTDPGATLQVG